MDSQGQPINYQQYQTGTVIPIQQTQPSQMNRSRSHSPVLNVNQQPNYQQPPTKVIINPQTSQRPLIMNNMGSQVITHSPMKQSIQIVNDKQFNPRQDPFLRKGDPQIVSGDKLPVDSMQASQQIVHQSPYQQYNSTVQYPKQYVQPMHYTSQNQQQPILKSVKVVSPSQSIIVNPSSTPINSHNHINTGIPINVNSDNKELLDINSNLKKRLEEQIDQNQQMKVQIQESHNKVADLNEKLNSQQFQTQNHYQNQLNELKGINDQLELKFQQIGQQVNEKEFKLGQESRRVQELEDQVRNLNQKNKELIGQQNNDQTQYLQGQLEYYERQNQSLQTENRQKDSQIQQMQQKMNQVNVDCKLKESQLKNVESEKDYLQQQYERSNRDIQQQNYELQEIRGKYQQIQNLGSKQQETLKKYFLQILENERLIRVIQEIVSQNQRMQNDVQKVKHLQQQNQGLIKQIEQQQKKIMDDRSMIDQLKIQNNNENGLKTQQNGEINELRQQILDLRSENSNLRNTNENLGRLNQDQMNIIEEINQELKQSQKQGNGGNYRMNDQIHKLEEQLREQQSINQDMQQNYEAKIDELLSTNQQLNDQMKYTGDDGKKDYQISLLNQKDVANQTKINRLSQQQNDLLQLVKKLTDENKLLQTQNGQQRNTTDLGYNDISSQNNYNNVNNPNNYNNIVNHNSISNHNSINNHNGLNNHGNLTNHKSMVNLNDYNNMNSMNNDSDLKIQNQRQKMNATPTKNNQTDKYSPSFRKSPLNKSLLKDKTNQYSSKQLKKKTKSPFRL